MDATDFDPSSPQLVPGERLGVWRLQRPLGEVPSGTWWRAGHGLGDQAALVLVYADRRDAGAVLLRMAAVDGQRWLHPDLAWPLDSGLTADGRPYVVMPLMEGEPLTLAVRGASLRQRLEWALQLCALLLAAQAQGLALVELDPSLLWVGAQKHLRLQALALAPHDAQAQRLGCLQGQLTAAAQVLQCPTHERGTPGGVQSQVYAVGMLICWMVNGRYPHDTGAESVATVQALTQWVSLPAPVRAALDALLCAAVHPDPVARPLGLEGLGQAIAAWLDGAEAALLTASGADSAPTSASLPPREPRAPAPAITPSEGAPASSRTWRGSLLLVGVLVAVAMVAVLTWRP